MGDPQGGQIDEQSRDGSVVDWIRRSPECHAKSQMEEHKGLGEPGGSTWLMYQ